MDTPRYDIFPVSFTGYRHELTIKTFNGQRVVTLKDVDELHKRPDGTARRNFNENKNRLISEVDYFVRNSYEAKTEYGIVAPNGLVLLTKSGYPMLVKSFSDDLAWDVQRHVVDGYFAAQEIMSGMQELSPILQQLIRTELEQKALKQEVVSLKDGLNTLTDNLTAVPDAEKVKDLLNEYQRWTRLSFDHAYNNVYDIMLDRHGIDVKRMVKNERNRLDAAYFEKTGRHYSESTLKGKTSGIDVMVRHGVLDKFHSILIGLLAKVKSERKL